METQTEDLQRLKEEYRIEFLQKKIKRLVDKINCIDTTYVEKEVLDNLDTERFTQLSDLSKCTFDELFDKFIFATNYYNVLRNSIVTNRVKTNGDMKMSLEEAIDHCKKVAENCQNALCRTEHEQLYDWLNELMNYRVEYPYTDEDF